MRVSQLEVKQNAFDKAEKTRQKFISLDICNYYSWILAGIVGVLLIRNILVQSQTWLLRRRRRRQAELASSASEKDGQERGAVHVRKPTLLRLSDRVDAVCQRSIGFWPFTADWTYLRVLLVALFLALNIVSCLVVDLKRAPGTTVRANVPRAFARRVGRIATANLPWLYAFAGRNSIITRLTNVPYQEIRFYHKLVGWTCFVECFVHTIAYTAYYVIFLDMEALHEEYTELYFKMGIAAMVGGLVSVVVAIRAVRTRTYEVFLCLHILGAVLMLMGSFYHRPIMEPWVYAAAAIWAFERAVRIVRHFSGPLRSRVFLRAPVVHAEASLQDGAIKLSVPFTGEWQAGQHTYLSFWGTELLRRPWLYGQAHPFSIANMPTESPTERQMNFVLRVKKGITLEMARLIERKTRASESSSCKLFVSLEGLYGSSPRAEDYDSVVLVAGGSGITHVASVLEEVSDRVETATTAVTLIWAVRHLSQAHWLDTALVHARSAAQRSGLNLIIRIFVTRPDTQFTSELSRTSSGSANQTPASTPDLEKKDAPLEGQQIVELGNASVQYFRPNIAQEVNEAVSRANGEVLVVACGPEALAEEVRAATSVLSMSAVTVQIAKFES